MSIIIMAMMDNYYALGNPVPFCPPSWRWVLSSQMASPTAIVKCEYRLKRILHILCYSSSSRSPKRLEICTGWKIGLFSNCYLLVRKDTEYVHYNNGYDGQLLCSWKPCSFLPAVLTMGIVQPNGQSHCNCEKWIQIENIFKRLKFSLDEKLDY